MRNKKLAEKFRNRPCIVCGATPSVGDHVKHFAGVSVTDKEINLWPLCTFGANAHHEEKHLVGLTAFVEKYSLKSILLDRGFYFCDLTNKWRHAELAK